MPRNYKSTRVIVELPDEVFDAAKYLHSLTLDGPPQRGHSNSISNFLSDLIHEYLREQFPLRSGLGVPLHEFRGRARVAIVVRNKVIPAVRRVSA